VAEPAEASARESLRAAQAALVAALVVGARVPEGFDADRVRIQADSLLAKRRGTVARVRPDLVRALGADFGGEFTAYAAARSRPAEGTRADAGQFAEWLRSRGRLPAV
jgi:hypothetical protein